MNKLLQQNNLKSTKARELVLQALQHAKLPISAEDIYQKTYKKDNINLSTIYRTLNTLFDHNLLIKQVRQDGKAYFQLNRADHKHLIVCESCGEELTLDNCPLEDMIAHIAKQTGYTITNHNIELYGICKKCQAKQNL